MKFILDKGQLSGAKRVDDDYLVSNAFVVRSGIQIYSGADVGMFNRETVRVYRPEDEVRSPKSLMSFSHKPITLDHPPNGVDSTNIKELAVGEVSTEAVWEGNKIKLPLIIKDEAAIQIVLAGKRELSAGYTCTLDFEDGVTPDGEPYDAIQRNIRINHVAIVDRGRAGSECRIGDAKHWGIRPLITAEKKEDTMSDKLRKIIVDGLSVETTDAGAQAIDKLTKENTNLANKLTKAEEAEKAKLAEKEKELAKKDAEIDKLKKDQLSDADLDKLVQDRAALVKSALSVDKDFKANGLSDAGIRKAVVSKALGDKVFNAALEGKSDAYISTYIDVRFDDLALDAANKSGKDDPIHTALGDGIETNQADLTKIYKTRDANLSDAWKPKEKV